MTDNNDINRIVSRVSKLLDEIDGLKSDVKDLYDEAKSKGHHVEALRHAVKISREDAKQKAKRLSKEEMLDLYLQALGCLSDLPLGVAAIAKVSS